MISVATKTWVLDQSHTTHTMASTIAAIAAITAAAPTSVRKKRHTPDTAYTPSPRPRKRTSSRTSSRTSVAVYRHMPRTWHIMKVDKPSGSGTKKETKACGSGSYGIVLPMRTPKESPVPHVMKRFLDDEKHNAMHSSTMAEVAALWYLHHAAAPFVTPVHAVVLSRRLSTAVSVLQDYGGRSLWHVWQDARDGGVVVMGTPLRRTMAANITLAMLQLWACFGLLHLDLKPLNILANPMTGEVRLIDFGTSQGILHARAFPRFEHVTTLWYEAPECVLGAACNTVAADMWSLGCVLLEVALGTASCPWRGESLVDQFWQQCRLLGTPNPRAEPWASLATRQTVADAPQWPRSSTCWRDLRAQVAATSPRLATLVFDGCLRMQPEARWSIRRVAEWMQVAMPVALPPNLARPRAVLEGAALSPSFASPHKVWPAARVHGLTALLQSLVWDSLHSRPLKQHAFAVLMACGVWHVAAWRKYEQSWEHMDAHIGMPPAVMAHAVLAFVGKWVGVHELCNVSTLSTSLRQSGQPKSALKRFGVTCAHVERDILALVPDVMVLSQQVSLIVHRLAGHGQAPLLVGVHWLVHAWQQAPHLWLRNDETAALDATLRTIGRLAKHGQAAARGMLAGPQAWMAAATSSPPQTNPWMPHVARTKPQGTAVCDWEAAQTCIAAQQALSAVHHSAAPIACGAPHDDGGGCFPTMAAAVATAMN